MAINSHVSTEERRNNNDRVLWRSVRSLLPYYVNPTLNSKDLIERRINRHEHRMTNTNKNKNNVIYQPGDRVILQNVRTKDFLLNGTLESQRMSDDGEVVSYVIKTDKGFYTTRHKRFLRPLGEAIERKV